MNTLVEQANIIMLPTVDVRNSNSATADATYWAPAHDVRGYHRVFAKVRLSAWNIADSLTTCQLQQCTSAAGAGAKALTTVGTGATYDYNDATPVNAITETVTFDIPTDLLDTANGFYYVRIYAATAGNTGDDFITGVIVPYGGRDRYAERGAAAAAGATVYIVK